MPSETEVAPLATGVNKAVQALQAQSAMPYLALHTLGWKAFQDLCAQVCAESLKCAVSIYREAQDGGQDAVFTIRPKDDKERAQTGTVQCKFTSDPNKHLRVSDLTPEIKSIIDLVSKKQAHSYIYITNMSVDAPIAAEIRKKLQNLGVVEPYVYGREWITGEIKKSSRLRALVPRIYGLGDLSIILDERLADQTKALLGHLLPSLGVYAPTTAHRSAVRVLGEHGIVLLLGPPASGKSMLASILATTALNADEHRCFQVDGPGELIKHWNPHESGGFYWVDDAFGPNQLRLDYIDHWLSIMNKIQAAVASGNRFVLTSRSHIWKAAKLKLGTRNHPLFENGNAIVELSTLSPDESAQILYNHIKLGKQSRQWKTNVKPYIDQASKELNFLPEIARRLGDPAYTLNLKNLPKDLIDFIRNPKEFLRTTIDELDDAQRAALTLVFIHRSKLSTSIHKSNGSAIVADKFAVSQGQIGQALDELNGTFLVKKSGTQESFWSFIHPTISDALSMSLRQRPDLVELYLRGANIHEILTEVICDGNIAISDALFVPSSLEDLLISRIMETPDEVNSNRTLFSFLHERASECVIKSLIKCNPAIMDRKSTYSWTCRIDPKVWTFARAYSLGVLRTDLRSEISDRLEKAIFERLDSSILNDDLILDLFPPTRLIQIVAKLCNEMPDILSNEVESIVDNADPDSDPESNFDDLRTMSNTLRDLFSGQEFIEEKLDALECDIEEGIRQIEAKCERSENIWEGEDVTPHRVTAPSTSRSIFSDIDQ